ncbi:Uncharacterised protein [Fluoribacter dumoffii]|uniref:Uncharacterized protein n=1 Tax=Fluoribacter dumoffii TaxID=463 RepID=A0A377GCA2_9GAMM|nr:hypothetical protein Ldum_1832 [Fluoribacter dumoffii NY 23]STO22447.1 Uncharacterised protein [Fluoribacter dumoffii]
MITHFLKANSETTFNCFLYCLTVQFSASNLFSLPVLYFAVIEKVIKTRTAEKIIHQTIGIYVGCLESS